MEQLKEQTEQFINDWKEAFSTMDRRVFESELLSLLETAMRDAYIHGTMDDGEIMNFPRYFSQIKETLNPPNN